MSTTGKRSGLRPAIAVAILAVLAAVGLWYSAGERESDAVRKLARAPIGCDTTLDFAVPGEFLLFVETSGVVDDVPGDCGSVGAFDRTDADAPVPVVSMVDSSGDPVALDSSSGVNYSVDGRSGESIRSFVVETPGDHVITVESPTGDADFVLSVGRDPSNGVGSLRIGAVAAAVVGLLLAALLIVMGVRKDAALATGETTDGWPAGGVAPLSPPGMVMSPPASSWQPAVGPPTAPPPPPMPMAMPPSSSVPGTPPSGPVIADQDAASAPSPWAPQHPSTEGSTGATGDGERSPWGPPTEKPS
jgi:hypothetical protein